MQSPPGAEAVIDGQRCLYFAGTAYLGLQSHPQVIEAACNAAQRYGIGAATSRAGFGNQPPTLELEAAAAEYFGQPAALYLASGYAAPAALLAALSETFAAVFVDEQSHYAGLEAIRATGRPMIPFRHRDPADLRRKLRSELSATQRPAVLTDGVFAATGRIAPVSEYRHLLGRYPGSCLVLDDAHGAGVLGEAGRGTLEHFGAAPPQVNQLAPQPTAPRLYTCATLSKALGGYGGIIAGAGELIEQIKACSRQYEGCTAPPAPVAAASARALRLLIEDPSPRRRLAENARRLRAGLLRIGLDIEDLPTPIVAIDLGDSDLMIGIQRRLLGRGVAIGCLRYPGTGDRAALRIAVSAAHTGEMIDLLLDHLRASL